MANQIIFDLRQFSQKDLNRVPKPSHRHAAPFAPWPWIDLADGLFFWLHVSWLLITNNMMSSQKSIPNSSNALHLLSQYNVTIALKDAIVAGRGIHNLVFQIGPKSRSKKPRSMK